MEEINNLYKAEGGKDLSDYLPRAVDKELDMRLDAFEATPIIGSKRCEKQQQVNRK